MLTGLTIGNFKAFGEPQHIPIRPLTLIFGANSSGKSSIVHSLMLVKHAVETGEWDVRKPSGAESTVDLGGFPQYLHRPRTEEGCEFGFGLPVGRLGELIRGRLVGDEAERAPFLQCRECVCTLRVERAPVKNADGSETSIAALQSVTIAFNGEPALRFSRADPRSFRCTSIELDNPFIRELLWSTLRFGVRHQIVPSRTAQHLAAELRDSPSTPFENRRLEVETAVQAEALHERARRISDPSTREPELGALAHALKGVMAERVFELSRDGLVDAGPDDQWGWAGWRDQLDDGQFGSVLEFFQDHCEPSLAGQRWAEAQSLRYNLSSLIEGLSAVWLEIVRRSGFLGPLRPIPPRHLLELQRSGTARVSSTFDAWIRACEDSQIRETVNRWLGPGCLNTPYRLTARTLVYSDDPGTAVGLPDLQFEERSSGLRLGHHDLGFGVGQVLPVLVHAAHRSRGIVAIEQPELHLHPALQAELGDVFIESALGERKKTFLLETHSEHLILRIMRRMRETHENRLPTGIPGVRPEHVSVVFVEPGPNGSLAREMPLNPRGELIKSWPGGFFEEGFRELFA